MAHEPRVRWMRADHAPGFSIYGVAGHWNLYDVDGEHLGEFRTHQLAYREGMAIYTRRVERYGQHA